MTITVRDDGSVRVIALAYPPVNALSVGAGLVGRLREAVAAAVSDPAVQAIVITGEGKIFSGGADINDFDGDPAELRVTRTMFDEIEAAAKPVVVALNGMALGGGLELALAGHYRIAAKGARLGLPEVTLGLLPGGGGTQRLPRLAGFAPSIEMMVSGKPIPAEQAAAVGLVDAVADGDPVAAALDFVKARPGLAPRPTGQMPVPEGAAEAVAAARAKLKPGALSAAPAFIIDCVEAAASLPLKDGLAFEARRFVDLMTSEASLGLRHAFFGQRAVGQIPGLPRNIALREINTTAVIGAGLMGTGITIALLNAGLPVTLIEARAKALDKAKANIQRTIERDVQRGRLSSDAAAKRLAGLTPSTSIEDAANADLVIEAVFEDMAVKEEVFRKLERIAGPPAILASNTSMLDLDVIAGFTSRPENVVGLHFFSPANIMKLLEIVRGAKTSPEVLATAMAFAKRIGKIGVVAGVCDGFIGNRMFEEYLRQAYFLAEEGALPQQVDAAMEAWGMAMGPFRTLDLAGQDVAWSVRKRRAVDMPDRVYSGFPDRICEMGRFGQKVGKGIYLYPDGRTPQVDPEIDALLIAYSAEKGITRRQISDQEIVDRCVLALVNEGARVVADGTAYRPVDVDMVYLTGYGFPAERGGPLFHADRIGLPKVVEKITALQSGSHGDLWEPAPLLVELAKKNGAFGSLNVKG